MSRPSRRSVPASISVRPAIMRSSVDLPQPEGPTKTTNSPFSTARSMPLIALSEPKCFSTPRSSRNDMQLSQSFCLLDGAEGQALDQLLLAEPADDDDGSD